MAEKTIYLDNAATTRCDPAVAGLIYRMLTEEYGNPSSLHGMGLAAERAVDRAAAQVAAALHCSADEIIFTSGATEANNLALCGAAAARRRRGTRLLTSPAEHASVTQTMRHLGENGYDPVFVPVRPDSTTDPAQVEKLTDENTTLISFMLVNNETGAVNDVAALAAAARRKNPQVLVHCDAVQALGKEPMDLRRLPVDLLSVSGHKIFGPKGVGALFVRKGTRVLPLAHGGKQQRGIRPGTENTPYIAGFGLACETAARARASRARHAALLRARFCAGLQEMDGAYLNSPDGATPFIINVSLTGLRSETLLHFLEARGIYVSSGSACTKGARSHVLAAAGLSPARIDSALRLSFSEEITAEDIDAVLAALREAAAVLARAPR